ncbi:MAG TPA: Npun_F0494 family protein [Leptolyngbyaceae cyanobacterium]
MTSSKSRSLAAITYPEPTVKRAERALRCSPFRPKLLADMRSHSVSLRAMADDRGIHNYYTRSPLSELAAENELMWLIAVGLLRREVDGQGLTDSFRLTPLGRQLLQKIEDQGFPEFRPGLRDQLYNSLSRWLRLPGWLQ